MFCQASASRAGRLATTTGGCMMLQGTRCHSSDQSTPMAINSSGLGGPPLRVVQRPAPVALLVVVVLSVAVQFALQLDATPPAPTASGELDARIAEC